MGEQLTVEQLYHKSWFKPLGLSTLLFILYVPVGICLLIIRAFILLQFFVLGYALPPSKFRQKCLRVMSAVLGISITSEGESNIEGGKVFVANHITTYDHFAINLTTNAIMATKEKIAKMIAKPFGLIELAFESLTKDQLEASSDSFIVFPEGATTSGEAGLLAFTAVEIPPGVLVQPVAVKVSRSFLNSTSISTSGTLELAILLFCPNTHFVLKFLPPQTTDPEGSWKTKIQSEIASCLGLTGTKLNSSDKAEFLKRLYFRPPNLATMAREVQKKLAPHTISPELILSTLQRTGSVEATLESLRQSSLAPGGINPPPSTFSKSASQRMMTFQERKRIMIATARQKYIEKHNLNLHGKPNITTTTSPTTTNTTSTPL